MDNSTSKEIIKGAILMEKKGRAFYENVAKTTESATVREIFTSMAMEEIEHANILKRQYEALANEGTMQPIEFPKPEHEFHSNILSEKVKKEISGAGYEAAAISAALSMEQGAVTYYGQRAESAEDPEEKALYQWLADWEKTHVDLLAAIDNDLREEIWYDQHFWPVL